MRCQFTYSPSWILLEDFGRHYYFAPVVDNITPVKDNAAVVSNVCTSNIPAYFIVVSNRRSMQSCVLKIVRIVSEQFKAMVHHLNRHEIPDPDVFGPFKKSIFDSIPVEYFLEPPERFGTTFG